MSNVDIRLNTEEVRAFLLSDAVGDICEGYADRAVELLGEGYEASRYAGKNRVNVSVAAVSEEAVRQNLEQNTVIKAVYASHD